MVAITRERATQQRVTDGSEASNKNQSGHILTLTDTKRKHEEKREDPPLTQYVLHTRAHTWYMGATQGARGYPGTLTAPSDTSAHFFAFPSYTHSETSSHTYTRCYLVCTPKRNEPGKDARLRRYIHIEVTLRTCAGARILARIHAHVLVVWCTLLHTNLSRYINIGERESARERQRWNDGPARQRDEKRAWTSPGKERRWMKRWYEKRTQRENERMHVVGDWPPAGSTKNDIVEEGRGIARESKREVSKRETHRGVVRKRTQDGKSWNEIRESETRRPGKRENGSCRKRKKKWKEKKRGR